MIAETSGPFIVVFTRDSRMGKDAFIATNFVLVLITSLFQGPMPQGPRSQGPRSQGPGSRVSGPGSRVPGPGFQVSGPGSQVSGPDFRLCHVKQMSLYNFIILRKKQWAQMKTKQLKQGILNQ